MQVHYYPQSLPAFHRAVVTIGSFDGVHLGHQKIIAALQEEAQRIGGETVIITFDPHPRKIINERYSLQMITTLNEKIYLLDTFSVDHLVVVPFTKAFAEQTANAYIEDFLVHRFRPHSVIIGYDHRFGKDRAGGYQLLEQKAGQFGYRLMEIPKHVIDEISISSTAIRNALLNSDIATANKLLGYPFFFEGMVVRGDALGRTLGYPTANLEYTDNDKIRLGHGVYAVYATISGEQKKGMLSIGTRPTINDRLAEKTEVNLFDFNGDLYDKTVKVSVKKFLRKQEKYNSLDELTRQMELDKKNSLECLD